MADEVKQKDLERFWSKVNKKAKKGCWEWTAYLNNGYGTFYINKKQRPAHRISLLIAGHELIAGLNVDHLCRNTKCVNPSHLEQVPPAVNSLRGFGCRAINARKKFCDYGHELTPDNYYYYPPRRARLCRKCKRRRDAKIRQAQIDSGYFQTPKFKAQQKIYNAKQRAKRKAKAALDGDGK